MTEGEAAIKRQKLEEPIGQSQYGSTALYGFNGQIVPPQVLGVGAMLPGQPGAQLSSAPSTLPLPGPLAAGAPLLSSAPPQASALTHTAVAAQNQALAAQQNQAPSAAGSTVDDALAPVDETLEGLPFLNKKSSVEQFIGLVKSSCTRINKTLKENEANLTRKQAPIHDLPHRFSVLIEASDRYCRQLETALHQVKATKTAVELQPNLGGS